MIRFLKEVIDIMAMVYATLILKGKKHVSDVPNVIKDQRKTNGRDVYQGRKSLVSLRG